MLPGRPLASPTHGGARHASTPFRSGPKQARTAGRSSNRAISADRCGAEPHTHAVENPPRPAITTPAADTSPRAQPDPARAASPHRVHSRPPRPHQEEVSDRGVHRRFPHPARDVAKRQSAAPRALQPACRPYRSRRAARDRRSNSKCCSSATRIPHQENPLCYRERAYLLPRGTTVPEAEAALRWKLADLQNELEGSPRGKFVNLAVFDHRWQDAPERPPVIVLQWRDWRTRSRSTIRRPVACRPRHHRAGAAQDDRIADVFEALEALARMRTPAEALDFAMRLLETTIQPKPPAPASTISTPTSCASSRCQAPAPWRCRGAACRAPPACSAKPCAPHTTRALFKEVLVEPPFDPAVDSRVGLDPRNILLRPIVHEHQLLGALQLINSKNRDGFTTQDIHVMNYVAERLAEFLLKARAK